MPDTARRTLARPSGQKTLSVAEAKLTVLDEISKGAKVEEACVRADRSIETYRDWMKKDPQFKADIALLRRARSGDPNLGSLTVPAFDVFCRDYLNQPLHAHQLRMWDVIEGREPRDVHPVMRFQRGQQIAPRPDHPLIPGGRVICNIPPGHAKTTTFSVNYAVWLIHRDPTVRIIIVSKSQSKAIEILGEIKFKLTAPVYREMHARFAPDGGWKDPDGSWKTDRVYVQGRDGAKDPTVQALGIGGQIYGARSDVIILDDSVILSNVSEYEKQHRWLDQEVESRLDGAGLLLLLGTRVSPMDLYKEMRDVEDYDEEPVYTYFSMPAILDEGDGQPANWVPLWPERFSGARLRKIRRDETTWALVYQQQDVAEDATFNAKAVAASINSQRFPGPMTEAGMGHRQGGMTGLYVVGGLDPATVGHTAMVVTAVDRVTQKRYVLDGVNHRQMTPKAMREHVYRLTDLYHINEWVIERNAFQRFLTQDTELVHFLRSRGCKLTEHYTTENKYDPDFGISAMAQLFMASGEPPNNNGDGAWRKTPEKALIELPQPKQNAWVGELINQMVIWQPSGMKQSAKTDLVMALWFCEIGIRRILDRGHQRQTHIANPFASTVRLRDRQSYDLATYREAMRDAAATG